MNSDNTQSLDLAVDGTHLNFRLDRSGPQSPWLLFSNSLATSLEIFDAQAAAFAGRFNILRYNQRGHGSSGVSMVPDFEMLAQDIIALLDHMGASSCTYVGLSMGVPTGLAAYARASGRFNALVFLDGQATSASGSAEQWQTRIETAKEHGMEAIAKAMVERWLVSEDPSLHQQLEHMIASTPLDGFVAAAACLKSYDFSNVLPMIDVPVLTIAGENDGLMPTKMSALAETVRNGRFVEIPLAGHLPCFEQPQLVNDALFDFFEDVIR